MNDNKAVKEVQITTESRNKKSVNNYGCLLNDKCCIVEVAGKNCMGRQMYFYYLEWLFVYNQNKYVEL